MQNGPLLGHIDLLAAKHRGNAPAQAALLGKLHEQPDGLVGYAVLRVVEINARRFGRKALTTPGIVSEELSQMQAAYRLVMLRERLPRRALCQRWPLRC
jgi:hypothetical protein